MYKKIYLLLSLSLQSFTYAMQDHTTIQNRTSLAKKFYYYCKLGNAEQLSQLRQNHTLKELSYVWQDVKILDCNSFRQDLLQLAFTNQSTSAAFDVVHELTRIYGDLSLFHEIINNEKNIKEFLTIGVNKGLDLNHTAEESRYLYSPFGHYVVKNSGWLDYNDPVLQLFIQKGAYIKGRTIKLGYDDNIFHNLMRSRTYWNMKDNIRITKAICFLKLAPVYEKIRKNISFSAAQKVCIESPELQEIKDALDQKNMWGNTVYAMLTSQINVLPQQDIAIFNSKEWATKPLIQLGRCMPKQEK